MINILTLFAILYRICSDLTSGPLIELCSHFFRGFQFRSAASSVLHASRLPRYVLTAHFNERGPGHGPLSADSRADGVRLLHVDCAVRKLGHQPASLQGVQPRRRPRTGIRAGGQVRGRDWGTACDQHDKRVETPTT